ncbi:MAG: hypothetical protein AAF738_06070 [Bacteroidota bacterium]
MKEIAKPLVLDTYVQIAVKLQQQLIIANPQREVLAKYPKWIDAEAFIQQHIISIARSRWKSIWSEGFTTLELEDIQFEEEQYKVVILRFFDFALIYLLPKKNSDVLQKSYEKTILSFDEMQRAHILNALKQTNWRVSGEKGAAAAAGSQDNAEVAGNGNYEQISGKKNFLIVRLPIFRLDLNLNLAS